jgi:hypothetical protein
MIEFNVIGELRNVPGHLLLLGGDGRTYDYDTGLDTITHIEPDGIRGVHVIEEGRLTMVAPRSKIVDAAPAFLKAS